MKISVVVPVYNCAAYLEQCVKSLTQQTYKDIEIILVNDGSTDGSGELCRVLASSDTRIKVVDQENRGVSAARNAGIDASNGELITFVDSDDSLNQEACEFMLKLLEEYDADIVHCGYKHIVRDEIRLVHDTKTITVQNREEALLCLISGKLFSGSVWSKLIRRDILGVIRFNENIRINEDNLFCYEMFLSANKIVFADYAFYNYFARIGESACFSTSSVKKAQDSCFVSEYMYLHSKGTSLEDAAAERYLRSLSGQYRLCCKSDKAACGKIRKKIDEVAKSAKNIGLNMRLTSFLIRRLPGLYNIVYSAYSKVRKPNWEASKS